MSVNRLAQPRVRLPLVCAGAMTVAALGFGVASAKAAPTLVEDPLPIPAPIGAAALPSAPGMAAMPGMSGITGMNGMTGMAGLPGAAPGGSAAGVNAANSFLQALNGMLNRVIPGVGSIMPTDVSALTPADAAVPGAPALETPPSAPAIVPQTLAGSRTFSLS